MTEYERQLRDQFAIHCPQSWLDRIIPTTVGEIEKVLKKEGIIPRDRLKYDSPLARAYSDNDYNQLVARYRWKYADMMLQERQRLLELESKMKG